MDRIDHCTDDELQPENNDKHYLFFVRFLAFELSVFKFNTICSWDPKEEEANDEIDHKDNAEESAASVGLEDGNGVERIIEHY